MVDLLEEEVDGDGHEGEGGHFDLEDSADSWPFGGGFVLGVLGVFDFELYFVWSGTEPVWEIACH